MDHETYIPSRIAAARTGLTQRHIGYLCSTGAIAGACKRGKLWYMPESSVRELGEAADRAGYTPLKEESAGQVDYLYDAQNILIEPHHLLSDHRRYPFAVGQTSYIRISTESYYVDKTLLIRDLIDARNQVTLFTRPRRFGKTLALDMLKTFFEKAPTDTSVYFRSKNIWKCGAYYQSMQGRYPVIFLSFKDVKYTSWEDTLEALLLVLRQEFRRHAELADSAACDRYERDYYERMLEGRLSLVEQEQALTNLTAMLERHHQSKVILLIDEYDTPVQQGYLHGFYEQSIGFMRNLLSGGMKDNPSLAYGVLTGILRISRENLFSGLNNLVVNTVLDSKYSEYFGFTEDEIAEMMQYYGREEQLPELRRWYDGYRFGGRSIYNPWSVSNYMQNDCVPKPFWANTSSNDIIHELLTRLTPEMVEGLSALLQGQTVCASLNLNVIYPRLAEASDTIYSFLLMAGYLTPAAAPVETPFGTVCELGLPNLEIRRIFHAEILDWVRPAFSTSITMNFCRALAESDSKRLQETLHNFLLHSASFHDTASEQFYHGMLLGLTALLSEQYFIRSNREAGLGRFDLQLEPKASAFPGILMEFKSVKDAAAVELEKVAHTALEQIRDKGYTAEMEERGVKKITTYGIAFCGKDAAVVMSRGK